jgi:MoaD family protein
VQVTIQFFSQLREIAGKSEETFELPEGATVSELLRQLYQRYPALENWDRNILVGAGVEFVERDYRLQPNDAIAIMPPVQGG